MRRLLPLVAMLLAALLASCAQVPTGSDPIAVRSVSGNGDLSGPDVHSVVPGPKPGMRTDQIVQGFLDATSADPDPRHQRARQFLTPSAAKNWDQGAQATIYTQRFVRPDRSRPRVTVTIARLGTVASDGAYRVTRGQEQLQFKLEKVKGEWRISNPPPGITVQSSDFSALFHKTNVYFLGANDIVVPEPRYFQVPTASLANRVMQALVAGPSSWLAPAVRTDIPKGAKLRRNVIEDSPATTVDLADLGSMTSAALKGMSAQIVFTLAGLKTSTVRILADGQQLEVPGVGKEQHLTDWEDYDPDALPASASAYVAYEGSVWALDGNRVPGPAGEGAYNLRAVGVSADRAEMAGVSEKSGRDHLYVGPYGKALADRLQANWLTRPTWGNRMYGTWTIRNGSDVIRVPVHGEPQVVSAPALEGIAPVSAMRLSRDGTRAAIIGNHGRLYLARISINTGRMSVDGLREIAPELRHVTDVAWASADTLSVLAPNSTSFPVVWDVSVDGSSRSAHNNISDLPGQLSGIAAAPGRQTLGAAEGTIWQLYSNGWSRIVAKGDTLYGDMPTYPD
ncbi:MAG TPA: LpqB family beta-propeller domain-containing protein [Mycobacteriales bacterium]|nr:LpqB family beta-propeller domain-containing protein [Mycobacteriales bacterium]